MSKHNNQAFNDLCDAAQKNIEFLTAKQAAEKEAVELQAVANEKNKADFIERYQEAEAKGRRREAIAIKREAWEKCGLHLSV